MSPLTYALLYLVSCLVFLKVFIRGFLQDHDTNWETYVLCIAWPIVLFGGVSTVIALWIEDKFNRP